MSNGDTINWGNIDSAGAPRAGVRMDTLRAAPQNGITIWLDLQQIVGATAKLFKATQIILDATTEMQQQLIQDFTKTCAKYGIAAIAATSAIVDYYRNSNEYFSQQLINDWVANVDSKRPHNPNEETSPGGRYYIYMKEQLQKHLEQLPAPAKSLVVEMLMESKPLQDLMRSDQMADHFEGVDDKIRKAYEQLYRKEPEKLESMRWHGLLFDETYNHKFLAKTRNGKIVEVTQDQIASWFPKGAKDFPHVIFTSSHAQGETLADVVDIIDGYASYAAHSGDGKTPLKLKHIDEQIMPGDTVIVYACDVRETPWKNGADLIRRVNELKRIGNHRDTKFNYISPGAIRIAKAMLKCKVEDRSVVDAQDAKTDTPGAGPITESLMRQSRPIELREDAGTISHHFQLMGFSKGGNVISDVGRYSNFALDFNKPDGRALFRMNSKQLICKKTDDFSMGELNIRNVMRGHAYLAHGAVEVGLCDWDIARGMVRFAVNNIYDLISAHYNYLGDLYRDYRLIVEGTRELHGHSVKATLGKINGNTSLLAHELYDRGFMLDNSEVGRFSFQYFAPNFGKAAIAHVSFNEDAAKGQLIIEAAPGTLDAEVIKHKAVIEKKLTTALGCRVVMETNPLEPGRLRLQCSKLDLTKNEDAVKRLQKGFAELRKPSVQGLVIAREIDEEIAAQLKKIKVTSRLTHSRPQASGRAAA